MKKKKIILIVLSIVVIIVLSLVLILNRKSKISNNNLQGANENAIDDNVIKNTLNEIGENDIALQNSTNIDNNQQNVEKQVNENENNQNKVNSSSKQKENTTTKKIESNANKNKSPIQTQNKAQQNSTKNTTKKQEENKQTTTEKKENQSKQTTSQTKSSSSTNKRESPDPLDNCKKGKHAIAVGNSGKWFNSHEECNQYYIKVISEWGKMLENGEITWEEYNKKCPKGYEDFSCMYCGKYTLDFYY